MPARAEGRGLWPYAGTDGRRKTFIDGYLDRWQAELLS
jgi:hypothetical protein